MKKSVDLNTQKSLYYRVMRKGKNKEMKEMTKLTFENVPEWTYWKNPKTGTILTLGVFREYENNPNWLSMSTSNTRYELNYNYTWDEIVEKFEYLGECDDDDFYKECSKKAKEKYGAQWKKDAREHHIKSREKGEKRRREFPQD